MTPTGEFTTLYNFCSQPNCSDGSAPVSLIQASDGNFYGVTQNGGVSSYCYAYGCGTVFKFTPGGQLTTIHTFCLLGGCEDGIEPNWLIQAANGDFYGVTYLKGAHGHGTLFELSGAGKFTTLHSFCAQTGCPDGASPRSLMQASNENLYGSSAGGPNNLGAIFELTPDGKLTTLGGGEAPNPLIQGGDGNLYGTMTTGGEYARGLVFRMTLAGHGTVLHNFCGVNCATGNTPFSGVVEGSDGNLYGSVAQDGLIGYAGALYEITSSGAFNTLYLFCSETNCDDGSTPGALMQDTNGTFYGTTQTGGTGAYGTIFALSEGLGPFVAARPSFGSKGQSITILGSGLTGATSLTFNGVAATFTAVSDTYIQAQVPAGATTGKIVVTTPSGELSSLPFLIP